MRWRTYKLLSAMRPEGEVKKATLAIRSALGLVTP